MLDQEAKKVFPDLKAFPDSRVIVAWMVPPVSPDLLDLRVIVDLMDLRV